MIQDSQSREFEMPSMFAGLFREYFNKVVIEQLEDIFLAVDVIA